MMAQRRVQGVAWVTHLAGGPRLVCLQAVPVKFVRGVGRQGATLGVLWHRFSCGTGFLVAQELQPADQPPSVHKAV
jgi:hypothetical protein